MIVTDMNIKERELQNYKKRSDLRPLTEEELRKVQRLYLRMASDVFEMCNHYGIYITLCGGSVLGAIRHQGFIPWDDDMDLFIPRKDYERFKLRFDEYFQGKYQLYAPNYHQSSHYRIGKIECGDVEIDDLMGYRHGLIIDLFVLENVPDFALHRWIRGIRSELYSYIAACCGLRESHKGFKSRNEDVPAVSLYERIGLTVGKVFSFRTADQWNNLIDKTNSYPDEQSQYVCSPNGRKHYFGEIYHREAMMRSIPVPFEDQIFPIPAGYDEFLGKLYGDYMVIPPEEKREVHYIRSIRFKDS